MPVCTFCRSKFESYPEYHTNADNFDVVTENGLKGSLDLLKSIINCFENALQPKMLMKGEPHLGKRNLYPNISKKDEKENL